MKSLASNHNHNTSGHSLRKFRNTKYFQDQRGYETDYMKRKNELAGSTPQQRKGKNKFDDQVNEYLRKVGSGLSESVLAADDNKNLDYASEVESKIKSLEAKHLASSVIFQKLSHCHSELMNLHNTKIPSNNNTFDKANITTRSIEVGTRPATQRQFKSQSHLAIISTPYKSPSFQNKKSNQSTKSLQIHSKQTFFNQANNGETISKILESSLDRLDEEDMAEHINIKEKILDSLNDPVHQHDEFNNVYMNGIDEQEEYHQYHHEAKNLQNEINNQGMQQIHNKLDRSYDNPDMNNVDESDAYSISQKLILLGSNIKPKTPLKHESSYFLSPNIRSSAEKARKQERQLFSQQSQNLNQKQQSKLNYLSPDSSQKKPAPASNKTSKNDKFIAQQLIGQINGLSVKSPNAAQQSQKQVRQQTPEKNVPKTGREINGNLESAQKQQRSPSQQQQKQQNGQQSSSKKKIEKYYLSQVERQNDLVQQQQKQIIQYQQQLQQQTLEFQLFMQEQQLLSQQNYFQQQQQLMNQQRSSANMFLQQPFLPLSLIGAPANPLFSFNHLNSPLVMQTANPTQNAAFIPQVPPPIIINNNIQKNKEEELNNPNNNNNNLNGSMSSQQHQTAYQTSNKTHSLQIPFYEKNGDETLTPAGQQGTADQSQIDRQTEQIFKSNNNNSNSFAGHFAKKSSSQRRKWDIGQKTCTQSELSADEDYLTQYNREVKQPRQFDYNPQLYLPPQQNTHQNQPTLIQYKKPVKFDIFWEKDEIEQENKENQRNNSNKKTNYPIIQEENKLEYSVQKQSKNVADQPDNQANANPQNYNRSLQDMFVSKKTDLQTKLDYERNKQQFMLSYRNYSPDLSKEDLIQIRRDLLKPKSQQVMQSINFDSHNQSQQQSHFQSQYSHISQGFPANNLAPQTQVNQSISTNQTPQKLQIQTTTIQLSHPTTTADLNAAPLVTPNTAQAQQNNMGILQKQVITQPQQVNTLINQQSQISNLQKPYTQTQNINTQQKPSNLPQQPVNSIPQNFQPAASALSTNQFGVPSQQNQLYNQQHVGGGQLSQQQPQQQSVISQSNLPQQNGMIQINPQTPIQIQSQFQQPFIPLHQPYQLNQNTPVNQIQQYHRITSN